jgi:hypothetical protein
MSNQPTREEIEVRAYELYRQCGCQHGHDLQHWLEAEQELSATDAELEAREASGEIQHKSAAAGRSNR